jgi:hypothetical protein
MIWFARSTRFMPKVIASALGPIPKSMFSSRRSPTSFRLLSVHCNSIHGLIMQPVKPAISIFVMFMPFLRLFSAKFTNHFRPNLNL